MRIHKSDLPEGFSFALLAQKYNLDPASDFIIDVEGFFLAGSIPDLSAEELLEFVPSEPPPATLQERVEAAETIIDLLLMEAQ
jgi:hypothetical protein